MPADRDTLTRRLDNLKKLALLATLMRTEEGIRESIQNADNTNAVETIGYRYLLRKRVDYRDELATEETDGCDTLEEVEDAVITFLYPENTSSDHAYYIDVYDLNLGRKLKFNVDIRVKWDFEKEASGDGDNGQHHRGETE